LVSLGIRVSVVVVGFVPVVESTFAVFVLDEGVAVEGVVVDDGEVAPAVVVVDVVPAATTDGVSV
jgi:hypothetical protein